MEGSNRSQTHGGYKRGGGGRGGGGRGGYGRWTKRGGRWRGGGYYNHYGSNRERAQHLSEYDGDPVTKEICFLCKRKKVVISSYDDVLMNRVYSFVIVRIMFSYFWSSIL